VGQGATATHHSRRAALMPRPDPRAVADSSASLAADIERRISAQLFDQIADAIADADGLLPFDRFMELALYAPGLGYYVAGAQKLGPGGDFVTAPELSPLFGDCLAHQSAEVLEALGGGSLFEFGAGSGALAAQILTRLGEIGALPDRYLILEPSPELQARQREHLQRALPKASERCVWLTGLPEDFSGVVIANEVLDAMPVHRFRIGEDGAIQEVFVRLHQGQLSEVAVAPRSPGLREAVQALIDAGLASAPGYSSEINLRLPPWLNALAKRMTSGLILLIDYGYPRAAYFQPDRYMGSLMCHFRHQAHGDPYRHLGLQDITAHVDFTAVAEAGEQAGLELEGFTTQAHFLIGCGIDERLASADDLDLALGAKQLLLPTAMGERFKVIGLGKGISAPWRGFAVRDLSDRL
jgi:SAM-dependent MidA family methyltransferase